MLHPLFLVALVSIAAAPSRPSSSPPSLAPSNPAIKRIKGYWAAKPVKILKGMFPDGPLLGNGDMGITVGGVTGERHSDEGLVLYLGLSQMWGIDEYKHTHDNDEVFPRRLGIGSLTIFASDANGNATFVGAAFSAVQDNEKGEVTATLTGWHSGAPATLSIRCYLHPSENVAITEISSNSSSAIKVNVTVAVLPLKRLCRTTPNGPTTCQDMDGSTDAGTTPAALTSSQSQSQSRTFYAVRQPLSGMSSPKPIRVAVANALVTGGGGGGSGGGTALEFECNRIGGTASSCTGIINGTAGSNAGGSGGGDSGGGGGGAAAPMVLVTALVTNWDTCRSVAGCGDPLPAALDAVQNVSTTASIAAIKEANSAWWNAFWEESWVRTSVWVRTLPR